MQQTQPKTFTMSPNGAYFKIQFDWRGFLLALATTGTITCVGFLVKVSNTLAVIQEQHIQDKEDKDDLKQDLNEIKLDIREIRTTKADKQVTK